MSGCGRFKEKEREKGYNLSHEQWESLTSLHKNDELIVKPADKGGAIVIWPRELYLTEAYKQLNNNLHYKLIQNDPFPTLIKTTCQEDQLYSDAMVPPPDYPNMPTIF